MAFQLPTKSPLIPKEGYLSLHWYPRFFITAGWRWSSASPSGFQWYLSEWGVSGVPCYCLHCGLHWSHRGVGGLITTGQRHRLCLSLGLLWNLPSGQGGREAPHYCRWAVEIQVPMHSGVGKGTCYWTARMETPSSSLASLIPHYAGEHWGMSLPARDSGMLGSLHCGGGATVFSAVFG